MEFIKKTIVVRDSYYERLRWESFRQKREIKEIIDEILEKWITDHPTEEKKEIFQGSSLSEAKDQQEKQRITEAMQQANNKKVEAARILKISRVYLFGLIKKHGLNFPPSSRKKSKV